MISGSVPTLRDANKTRLLDNGNLRCTIQKYSKWDLVTAIIAGIASDINFAELNPQTPSFLVFNQLNLSHRSIGTFLSGSNRILQNSGLRGSFRFLLLDRFPSDPQQPKLYAASNRQKETEEPRPPFVNVVQKGLLFCAYRQGRDAREGYAVLSFLCCYFACMFGVFWGLTLSDRNKWIGYAILVLAIAIGVAAALTGARGRLPWDWGKDGYQQQQTEYRQTFQHDSAIVPQKYLDTI